MFEEDTRLYRWNSKVPNFLPPLDTHRSVRYVSRSHDPILDLTKTFYPSHFGPAKRVRRVFDSQKPALTLVYMNTIRKRTLKSDLFLMSSYQSKEAELVV